MLVLQCDCVFLSGTDFVPTPVQIKNARKHPELNLDDNGFAFGSHKWEGIDFYDDDQIITK